MQESIKNKILRVKLVIMDVDGILTDGRLAYGNYSEELKFFDVKDGYGVYLLNKAGLKTALVSAGNDKIIKRRARDMKVNSVYCTRDKLNAYKKLKSKFRLKDENICFVGDDFLDLPPLRECGFSATVCDASEEIKSLVDFTSSKPGGRGGMREIAELILKTKGVWETVVGM